MTGHNLIWYECNFVPIFIVFVLKFYEMHVLIDLYITPLQDPLFCTHLCVYSQILVVWFILCINLQYDQLHAHINAHKFSSAFILISNPWPFFNINFNKNV